jgi:hypothetical protein
LRRLARYYLVADFHLLSASDGNGVQQVSRYVEGIVSDDGE